MDRRRFSVGFGVLLGAARGNAQMQARRQPSIVIPYTPGGSTDILGRQFADVLSVQMDDKYVVENRPGANGMLGAAHVAAAPQDGRTLLYTYGNLLLTQEFLLKDQRLRPLDALVPIARICMIRAVMVAATHFPAESLREFIELARRNPGRHSYAYYGDLGIASLAAEAGLNLLRVPYKGGLPGMIDVAAGNVDIITSSLTQALPMLRAGKLKVLATSGEERLPELPAVPTVKEIVPGYRTMDYQVVMAPKGTPAALLSQLSQKVSAALAVSDLRKGFGERGAIVAPMAPDEVLSFMQADRSNIAKVVKVSGIQPE